MMPRPVLDCRRAGCLRYAPICLLAAFAFDTTAAAATHPLTGHSSTLQQPAPKQEPKPAPAPSKAPGDLDAEREKLRIKDVEGWKKLQVKSLDQVIDVKKTTQPLEWPAAVTEEQKTKLADLLQKAKDGGGGARTGRALREMEKMGQPALVFLINELREVNYKDTSEAMFGYQLNMTLQNITLGVNTGYVAVEVGEEMDPRKAQWNAMTVQQWQSGLKTWWPTQEKFEEYIKGRKAKRDAELEGEKKGEEEKPKTPPKPGSKK